MIVIATVLSYLTNAEARREEKGATAVEYGLLVALIAAVIIVAVTAFGTNLSQIFTDINSKI
jgi:pilus assembly protein Flp/PilA